MSLILCILYIGQYKKNAHISYKVAKKTTHTHKQTHSHTFMMLVCRNEMDSAAIYGTAGQSSAVHLSINRPELDFSSSRCCATKAVVMQIHRRLRYDVPTGKSRRFTFQPEKIKYIAF